MKIQYVIAIHLMRWPTNFYDFTFKWTATSGIGIHPTKLSRQFFTLPIVQTLLPVTFRHSLSSRKNLEAVVIRRKLPWGLPEVVGTVQQERCSWRRLLRKRLEFHVCTINKSIHTKKVVHFVANILNEPEFFLHEVKGIQQFPSNINRFGLVSLFNVISTFVGYLMPKLFS